MSSGIGRAVNLWDGVPILTAPFLMLSALAPYATGRGKRGCGSFVGFNHNEVKHRKVTFVMLGVYFSVVQYLKGIAKVIISPNTPWT